MRGPWKAGGLGSRDTLQTLQLPLTVGKLCSKVTQGVFQLFYLQETTMPLTIVIIILVQLFALLLLPSLLWTTMSVREAVREWSAGVRDTLGT